MFARLFNAADAFSGTKYTRKSKCQDALAQAAQMALKSFLFFFFILLDGYETGGSVRPSRAESCR